MYLPHMESQAGHWSKWGGTAVRSDGPEAQFKEVLMFWFMQAQGQCLREKTSLKDALMEWFLPLSNSPARERRLESSMKHRKGNQADAGKEQAVSWGRV